MQYEGKDQELKNIEPNEKGNIQVQDNIEVVLAGCHQLFEHEGKLQGDSIEMLFF